MQVGQELGHAVDFVQDECGVGLTQPEQRRAAITDTFREIRSREIRRDGLATIDSNRSVDGDTSGRAVERSNQVGDELVGVFDAHGIADEVVLDADRFALLGAQLKVAHQRRLLD